MFVYIQAHSEPLKYLESFRHYSRVIHSYFERYRQIQTYLELWLIWANDVSRIFMYIHKFAHIEAYFPTLGHISPDSDIFRVLTLPVQIM